MKNGARRKGPVRGFPLTRCPECKYLRDERAAIHEFDGKMSREDAERAALSEMCPDCWNQTNELIPTQESQLLHLRAKPPT